MKSLMMVFVCCLALGCGAQDSTWDENTKGKAEDFSAPKDKPTDIHDGYQLTLGQEDIFKTHKKEIQVFYVDVPEGTHGYSLSIWADEFVWSVPEVETAWSFVPEDFEATADELLEATVEDLKEALGYYCSPSRQDCSNDSSHLARRNLGIFEGPGRLVMALRLVDRSSYQYLIKVNEIPTIQPGNAGLVVVGWTTRFGRGLDHGDELYYPELGLLHVPFAGDHVPFAGDVISLSEDAVLYSSSFTGHPLPFITDDTPWQSAEFWAPAGTELRVQEDRCYGMSIGAEDYVAGCWVTAE